MAVSMAVLDAMACTCLLPAWASCHLGLEDACSSEPAAIGPGALRRASARDRVTGQPTSSSAEETQRQGSLPYSLLCAHISVPRVGARVSCGAWVGTSPCWGEIQPQPFPWPASLATAAPVKMHFPEPGQLSFISHSKKMLRRWLDRGECVTTNLSRNLGCL